VRKLLDSAYRFAGYAAAVSLVLIFSLVLVQVGARLLDVVMRFAGLAPLGFIVPSIAEICGFLLAAASFLALAYTLTLGGHIRVGVFVDRFPPGIRRIVETLTGVLASILAFYFTYAVGALALKSWRFNDVSFGFVPVPLWLPQGVMALGLLLLGIAMIDLTWRSASRGEPMPGASEV
jgi:TRAP-type C4-dicarboxylate transport system permease small subunit